MAQAQGQVGDQTQQNADNKEQAKGPNDNWQADKSLDANGNPIDGATPESIAAAKVISDKADADKVLADAAKAKENKEGDKDPAKEDKREYDFKAPIVKQIENLVVEAGINAAEAAQAVQANDGMLPPEMLKALVDKHGEGVAALVADNMKNMAAANQAQASKNDTAIFSQVEDAFKGVTEQGGKETWGELATWAKENIPAEERKEINGLLERGGLSAKLAVDNMIARFKSADTFVQTADLLTGDNTSEGTGIKPLGKAAYDTALRKLMNEGHVYGQSVEIDDLDRRRTAGIKRNII